MRNSPARNKKRSPISRPKTLPPTTLIFADCRSSTIVIVFRLIRKLPRDYAQAVQLDPKFALAWARLGVIRSFLYFNGVDATTNSAAAVKEAADRAMALQPDLAEAWIAQGAYRYRVLRDFGSALQAYERRREACAE